MRELVAWAAAATAVNAQLRADETRLREQRLGNTIIAHLLDLIKQNKAAQAKKKLEQEQEEMPQLDVSHEKNAGGESAE
jgi:hypothetical protein